MIRLRAFANMARSKLGNSLSLEAAAAEVQVLEEAWTEPAAPLAVLPGSLDRATKAPPMSTLAAELAASRADRFEHAPVIRYVLHDCLVHRGDVEYRGGYLAVSPRTGDRIVSSRIEHAGRMHHCMSRVSDEFFGHWLTDACATALLADPGDPVILDRRPDWPDTERYAAAFGIATSVRRNLQVEELVIYSDHAQGVLKRERYARMKARLRDAAGTFSGTGRPVYLRRGATGYARLVANETELCEHLSAEGFDVVDLATSDFVERYRRLAAAPVVVSVDGSHVNHANFAMDAGSALVTLIPADRFTMVHRGYAHALGLRYGCVVVQPSAEGYVVSADEILRTVEMVA